MPTKDVLLTTEWSEWSKNRSGGSTPSSWRGHYTLMMDQTTPAFKTPTFWAQPVKICDCCSVFQSFHPKATKDLSVGANGLQYSWSMVFLESGKHKISYVPVVWCTCANSDPDMCAATCHGATFKQGSQFQPFAENLIKQGNWKYLQRFVFL